MNAPLSRASSAGRESADDTQSAFKAAMRHLVGGVGIVTAAHDDERNGLTATSLTSLSAEPPSLLVCLRKGATSLPLMRASGRFAVSLLGHGHEAVANRFAGREGTTGTQRFAGADWIGRPGYPPVLADALAAFECEVDEMLERYSHTIIIGRVTESRVRSTDGGALVYWRAAYDRVGLLKD